MSPTYWTPRASIDLWSVPAAAYRLREGWPSLQEAVYQDLDKLATQHSKRMGALGPREPR